MQTLRRPLRIIWDMDGTMTDFGAQYDADADRFHPGLPIAKTAQQLTFDLFGGVDERTAEAIRAIMDRTGFYDEMEPIPGALDAFRQMQTDGHDLWICTSPWLTNRSCVQDKLDWVLRHLGPKVQERVIISKDKTLVRGDILLDDKPDITGVAIPQWRQILVTQPYNVGVDLPRVDSWLGDWRSVVYADAAVAV